MRGSWMAAAAALLILIGGGAVLAGGGSSVPKDKTESPKKTPEQLAGEHYNQGLKLRDKAWDLEKKAASAASEQEQAKLLGKAAKQYEKAIPEYQEATKLEPGFYQAHSSLGYALRKTGRYDESLLAYNRALELSPDYVEAIEYRGEAFLGLDRVDDAKAAYLRLFGMDRDQADALMKAMKSWIENRKGDPGRLSAETISNFESWVEEREEVAGQTASLDDSAQRRW